MPSASNLDNVNSTTAQTTPYHYQFAVIYPTGMWRTSNFSVCQKSEDNNCRSLSSANSFNDHKNYFNITQSDFVNSNCPASMLL